MSIENYFGSVIHTRTREDALADGDLVDVSHMAREARFRIPVALTRAAWAEVVEWDDDRPEPGRGRPTVGRALRGRHRRRQRPRPRSRPPSACTGSRTRTEAGSGTIPS